MEKITTNRQTRFRRAVSIAVTVLLVLTVLTCLYAAIQVLSNGYVHIGGFMMFRVVTGSMEPTIPTGALMVARQVDIESIQLNDIICFRTQQADIWGSIVTHRVVDIFTGSDGNIVLSTKGDANLIMDSFTVTRDNLVGKVIWHTGDGNVLATVFSFFTKKVGFLGCIVLPCLLIAGLILKDCVKNIRVELQNAIDEVNRSGGKDDWKKDPLFGLTQEEYNEMYNRIKAELIEELMRCAAIPEGKTDQGIQGEQSAEKE